ncbi:MAG TPA: hypothetical protein VKQ30_08400 [Ktedonobacterales bacterium]|nr:hypothetical protein [Ktedonobacterales bacterium]
MSFWDIVGAGIAFGAFVGLLFLTFVGIGIVGLFAFVRFFGWLIR